MGQRISDERYNSSQALTGDRANTFVPPVSVPPRVSTGYTVHRRGTKSPGRRDSNNPPMSHHQHSGHPPHSQLPPVPHQIHHTSEPPQPTAHELAIAAQQAETLRLHAHHLHGVPSSLDADEIDPHTLVGPVQADQTNNILEQTKPWLHYDQAHPPAVIHGEAEALLADMQISRETWQPPSKHSPALTEQRVLRPSSQSPNISHPLSRGPHHAPHNSISLIHSNGRGGHHAPNNSISLPPGTAVNDSPNHRPHWRDNSIPFLNDPIEESDGLLRDTNGEGGESLRYSPSLHSKRGGHHAPQNSVIFPHGTSFAPSLSGKPTVGHHAPQNSLAFNSTTIAAIHGASPSLSTSRDHSMLLQQWPSQSSGLQRSLTGLSVSAEENSGTPQRVDSLGFQRSNSHHSTGGNGALSQVQQTREKFANVHALLESALQDARTPALGQKRSQSSKQLHPSPNDGRSTGTGSTVTPQRHTRRPSTSLVSSVIADEYDNLKHERIEDRLESNRLELDPELRRKHAAMIAKGVPVSVEPSEPEMSMAHWAAQIHEQILLEKREAERLEAEEAVRLEAENGQPPAIGNAVSAPR